MKQKFTQQLLSLKQLKYSFLFLSAVLWYSAAQAQAPAIEWQLKLGGSDRD